MNFTVFRNKNIAPLLVVLFLILPTARVAGLDIEFETKTEESISLSASWRSGGSADWIFIGQGEGGDDLVYEDVRSVEHFFGPLSGEDARKIILQPYNSDRIRRVIWSGQDLSGEIPSGLSDLENFYRLDLSDNLLSENLEYAGEMDQLIHLYLDKNLFEGEIPEELTELEDLEVLSLSNNNLTGEIPSKLGNLSQLTRLYLHNNDFNQFEKIEDEAGEASFSNLEVLTLKNNNLETLPEELALSKNLSSLNLRNNRLKEIFQDEDIEMSLNNLEYLDISNNFLECSGVALPVKMGGMNSFLNLRSYHRTRDWHPKRVLVDLRYNCLESIPKSLGDFSALQSLKLDNNNLRGFIMEEDGDIITEEGIPKTIGNLEGDNNLPFSLLSLYNNNLSGEIPSEIGDLENMEFFRAHNNNLSGPIPEELFNLNKLVILNLENNELDILPDEETGGGEVFGSASAENLQRLFMGRNEIENIPEELKLPSIRFAHLEENKIDELPENFGDNFQTVQKLTLYKNLLTELPDSFQDLSGEGLNLFTGEEDTGIYYLDLGTNLIENFPEEVVVLKDLEYLNLSRQSGQANTTPIRGAMEGPLPEEIENLTELETFLIQNNQLDHLPEDGWSGLSNLIYFYAQSNLLENLPSGIGELSSLERLYLNNNRIDASIPNELTETGNLLRAYLQYNSIVGPLPINNSWTRLDRFFADENQISGDISEEFVSDLPSVEYFSIHRNNLDGNIDPAVENMSNLRWWDLALNEPGLEGWIPASVGNLSSLEVFDFNNNRIELVPDDINNLNRLRYLYGFENNIDEFADNIGNMTDLIDFDFHTTDGGNTIPFPEKAEALPNLRYFSLGENESGYGEVDWAEWNGRLPKNMLFLNNNELDSKNFSEVDLGEVNGMVSFNVRNNQFEGGFPEE